MAEKLARLFACWNKIKGQLTPSKLVGNERTLHDNEAETKLDVTLLHKLSAFTCSRNNTSIKPVFQMPDIWWLPKDHYARVFARPVLSFMHNNDTFPIFATKSGDYLLTMKFNAKIILKISVADGKKEVLRLDTCFTYAHVDGTFWRISYLERRIYCYAENLSLLNKEWVSQSHTQRL